MKTVKIQLDPETGENYLSLSDLLDGTDVNQDEVSFYSMVEENGTLKVALYDKEKQLIKIK